MSANKPWACLTPLSTAGVSEKNSICSNSFVSPLYIDSFLVIYLRLFPSRNSIGQLNVWLVIPLITVILKTKTYQYASAQGTDGLVLTD